MPDRKKTSEELEDEMDRLVQRMGTLGLQLQETRRREAHTPTQESTSEQGKYKALLRKMIGRRVLITVKGPHRGKEGVITRHAGDTFHPVNWYVKLPDGSETRKHKGSFKLLPLESTSEEA